MGEAIKRILIVDDEENTRIGLSKLLAQEGFEVGSAADGNEALDYLGQQKVNLVISDINMPEMDGLTFVTNLRANDDYKALPILMVTTRSVKEDIIEAMKAGVNSYIVKPFTPDTLKAKILQVMDSK